MMDPFFVISPRILESWRQYREDNISLDQFIDRLKSSYGKADDIFRANRAMQYIRKRCKDTSEIISDRYYGEKFHFDLSAVKKDIHVPDDRYCFATNFLPCTNKGGTMRINCGYQGSDQEVVIWKFMRSGSFKGLEDLMERMTWRAMFWADDCKRLFRIRHEIFIGRIVNSCDKKSGEMERNVIVDEHYRLDCRRYEKLESDVERAMKDLYEALFSLYQDERIDTDSRSRPVGKC